MTEASVSFAGNLTDDPGVRSTHDGIARAMFRGRGRGAGAEPPVDDDQDHEESGSVASSTRDATVRDVGEACWRSAPSCPCC
jgi:hypothetical protein